MPFFRDLRVAVHSLMRTPGVALAVILTLALGIGDFSVMGFTMVGLGEPRSIQGGVVSGSYFDVMGLHPVLGRLIGPQDDGPNAAGVVVLTYRFWTTTLKK